MPAISSCYTQPQPDGSKLISALEMQDLWQDLNILFFGGSIPGIVFVWTDLADNRLGEGGVDGAGNPFVYMNPALTSYEFCDFAVLDFFSTLVHEAIHAFLIFYSCWWCRSWLKYPFGSEHGRLFQMLAKTLERIAPRLLGLPLRVGRFPCLMNDLGVKEWKAKEKKERLRREVPSVHDFETWELRDWRDVKNEDVRKLIEQTLAECEE